MGSHSGAAESGFQYFDEHVVWHDSHAITHQTVVAELKAALAREKSARVREEELLRERSDLMQRQSLMAQEFEHRFLNSLQQIGSLLSLQSRAATTFEAAAQLAMAARRVAAIGHVHRRLHFLDHHKDVEFKQYLQSLCDDLSSLLFPEGAGPVVMVTGPDIKLPTSLGIPLGLIVNELIINSVKYATGNIAVRIDTSPTEHRLTVSDDGAGLPPEFDPAKSRGLGMKIIQSLVMQIRGVLQFGSGEGGRGTCFTVAFPPPRLSER